MNDIIVKTPGVCGGVACVRNRRIPVWSIMRLRQIGLPDSLIMQVYPSIGQCHIEAAVKYADAHKLEILEDIRRNLD